MAALYVTENGAAFEDEVRPAGAGEPEGVADSRREAYLRAHLTAAYEAIQAGAPLRGYFAWSPMDTFEWSHGQAKRFWPDTRGLRHPAAPDQAERAVVWTGVGGEWGGGIEMWGLGFGLTHWSGVDRIK